MNTDHGIAPLHISATLSAPRRSLSSFEKIVTRMGATTSARGARRFGVYLALAGIVLSYALLASALPQPYQLGEDILRPGEVVPSSVRQPL